MITPWGMYWITRLDGVLFVATGALVLSALAVAVLVAVYVASVVNDDECMTRKTRRLLMRAGFVFALSGAVVMLVPTTKEMAAIKVVPMIANSECAKKLGDVGVGVLELTEEWLAERKPKREK